MVTMNIKRHTDVLTATAAGIDIISIRTIEHSLFDISCTDVVKSRKMIAVHQISKRNWGPNALYHLEDLHDKIEKKNNNIQI